MIGLLASLPFFVLGFGAFFLMAYLNFKSEEHPRTAHFTPALKSGGELTVDIAYRIAGRNDTEQFNANHNFITEATQLVNRWALRLKDPEPREEHYDGLTSEFRRCGVPGFDKVVSIKLPPREKPPESPEIHSPAARAVEDLLGKFESAEALFGAEKGIYKSHPDHLKRDVGGRPLEDRIRIYVDGEVNDLFHHPDHAR